MKNDKYRFAQQILQTKKLKIVSQNISTTPPVRSKKTLRLTNLNRPH